VQRDEEGSALVLALVFLTLFGLLIAAILGQVDANVRTTLVVRTHEDKVYGADAGIDYGIQMLQAFDTLCPDDTAGVVPLTAPPAVDGVNVDVTCETTEGNVLGVRGYAVVTTVDDGGATSLDTSSGSIDRVIQGPVWTDGDIQLDKPVKIDQADLIQKSPCQTTPIDKLTVPTPFSVKCVTTAEPDEDHDLPAYPSGGTQSATGDGGAACRTFAPGVYKTAPQLVDSNYFQSGFYYFEDIGDWTIKGSGANKQVLFGGTSSDTVDEPKVLTETPCATDTLAAKGVMFALGGSSRIVVDNNARIELFMPNQAAVGTGDPGISLRSVSTADSAVDSRWKASNADMTILDVGSGSGNTWDMAIHGLVYTPEHMVNLFVTGGTVDAQLLGGAKVLRIGLGTSNSGTGLQVSTKRGSGRRKVTLIAKATDPDGGRTIEARAVVRIENDAARTVTVLSRSVQ
jgi:hypothetical protein